MVAQGLVFGPGLGMLVALVSFGGDAIAIGLVIGAGLGVSIGAVLDAVLARRRHG